MTGEDEITNEHLTRRRKTVDRVCLYVSTDALERLAAEGGIAALLDAACGISGNVTAIVSKIGKYQSFADAIKQDKEMKEEDREYWLQQAAQEEGG